MKSTVENEKILPTKVYAELITKKIVHVTFWSYLKSKLELETADAWNMVCNISCHKHHK